MQVDDAEVAAVGIGNDELGDAVGAHEVEGGDGVFAIGDGLGMGRHDVGGGEAVEGGAAVEHAAEVAVGDDAKDGAGTKGVDNDGAAEAAGGHFENGVADGGRGDHLGFFVLAVEVRNAHVELFAEGTSRVEAGEVAGGEVAALDEGHGKGVAHDKLGGGATGGGEVIGAGLVRHGGEKDNVGLVGKERIGVADDGDKAVAEVFHEGNEDFDFWSVATLRDADDDVVGLEHAKVAMDGVGGMHEECGGAGAVECGNDFGGYVGALSYASNNDAPRGRKNGLNGIGKGVVNVFFESFNGFFFICNDVSCNVLYFFRSLQGQFFSVV